MCLEAHEELGLGYVPLGELIHGHAACSDGHENSAIAALDRTNFAFGVVEVGHGVFRCYVRDDLHLGNIQEGYSAALLLLLFASSIERRGGGRGRDDRWSRGV